MNITIPQVAYSVIVTDVNQVQYRTIAPVADRDAVLAVTKVGGKGGTLFFCQIHNSAFHPKENCPECQNAALPDTVNLNHESLELGVTTSNTP